MHYGRAQVPQLKTESCLLQKHEQLPQHEFGSKPGLRFVHVATFQLDNIAGILLQNSRGMMFDKTGQHFIAVKPRYGKTFERYLFAL